MVSSRFKSVTSLRQPIDSNTIKREIQLSKKKKAYIVLDSTWLIKTMIKRLNLDDHVKLFNGNIAEIKSIMIQLKDKIHSFVDTELLRYCFGSNDVPVETIVRICFPNELLSESDIKTKLEKFIDEKPRKDNAVDASIRRVLALYTSWLPRQNDDEVKNKKLLARVIDGTLIPSELMKQILILTVRKKNIQTCKD